MAQDIVARGLGARALSRSASLAARPPRFAFYDDFNRGPTSPGGLGTPASGAAYDLRGNGGSVVATSGYILNGKFMGSASAVAIYAVQTAKGPVAEIGCVFGWDVAAGAGAAASVAFGVSTNPGGASLISNLPLHVTVTQQSCSIGVFRSGVLTAVKTITFAAALTNGVDYSAHFQIDGNQVRYTVAGYSGVVYMAQLAMYYAAANYPFWELYYGPAADPSAMPYFKAAWYGCSAGGAADLASLLMAYWKLNNTGWTDATGGGSTLAGTNTPTTTTGVLGNGVNLTRASSQKLSAANSDYLKGSARDFTLSCWFKPTATPGASTYHPLVSKAGSSSNVEFALYVDGSAGSGGVVTATGSPDGTFGSAAFASATGVPILGGATYHAALVRDAVEKTIRLYVNGSLQGNANLTSVFEGASTFDIGFSGALNGIRAGSYWDGMIDEVALFASPLGQGGALRADQIRRLYNDGEGITYPF